MTAATPDHSPAREPSRPLPEPALDPVSLTTLRAPAVRRLLELRAQRRLTRAPVHHRPVPERLRPHRVAVAGRRGPHP